MSLVPTTLKEAERLRRERAEIERLGWGREDEDGVYWQEENGCGLGSRWHPLSSRKARNEENPLKGTITLVVSPSTNSLQLRHKVSLQARDVKPMAPWNRAQREPRVP